MFFLFLPPVFCWVVDDVFSLRQTKKIGLLGESNRGPRNWIHIPPIKGHGLLRLLGSRIDRWDVNKTRLEEKSHGLVGRESSFNKSFIKKIQGDLSYRSGTWVYWKWDHNLTLVKIIPKMFTRYHVLTQMNQDTAKHVFRYLVSLEGAIYTCDFFQNAINTGAFYILRRYKTLQTISMWRWSVNKRFPARRGERPCVPKY